MKGTTGALLHEFYNLDGVDRGWRFRSRRGSGFPRCDRQDFRLSRPLSAQSPGEQVFSVGPAPFTRLPLGGSSRDRVYPRKALFSLGGLVFDGLKYPSAEMVPCSAKGRDDCGWECLAGGEPLWGRRQCRRLPQHPGPRRNFARTGYRFSHRSHVRQS
jgi:hypothetical protein